MIIEALLLTYFENFNFLTIYFLKWRLIFDNFFLAERKTQNFFELLIIGFGPKGMPGRMCNNLRYKWGHTNKAICSRV